MSKQLSVAANTTVARQQTARSLATSTPTEIATRELAAALEAGKLLGTPLHVAQQEAVKLVEAATGVSFRPMLAAAPGQSEIPPEEEMLEPTDLAKRLSIPQGGAWINQALTHVGWQIRQVGGGWQPTPAGAPYAARHAWTAIHSNKHGYNWRWNCSAVEQIFYAHKILPVKKEG